MPKPTNEERLERIREWSEKRRNALESERRWVTRPQRYDYPIGIDPQGRPYTVDPTRRGRYIGCLVAGAVGDALGASVEFLTLDQVRSHYGPAGLTGYDVAYGRRARSPTTLR